MSDSPLDHVWSELLRRGVVAHVPAQPLGPGNVDRRPEHKKNLHRVVCPDGTIAKLTIGKDLSDLIARSEAWAAAVPDLACRPLVHLRIEPWTVLIETYFDGISLEQTVHEQKLPFASAHRAVARVAATLASTRRPSSVSARREEWEKWTQSLCALPLWKSAETTFLKDQLLPALAEHLLQCSPEIQWAHGDLIDRNILLNSTGEPRLIDVEFAQPTHFFPAEPARFHALSLAAREQPGLFASVWPEPNLEWQLFFWLTQISREFTGNSPAYVTEWLPHRLSTIRRLSEILFQEKLPGWPWPAQNSDEAAPLATVRLFWSKDGSWSEDNAVRIPCRHEQRQTLFFPVPKDSVLFRFNPAVPTSLTIVHRIACHTARDTPLCDFAGPRLHALSFTSLGDTILKYLPDGISIVSPEGDPQLAFASSVDILKTDTQWLELEVTSLAQTSGFPPQLFQIEECRWVDQPGTIDVRITGWCISPDDSEFVRVEAVVGQGVVATSRMLPRPDVRDHHQGKDTALLSGFALEISAVNALDFLQLVAISTTGRRHHFHLVQAGELPNRGPILRDYPTWAKVHDPDPPAPSPKSEYSTRFSILLPVFNPPANFLRECLASVCAQHHGEWELCIVDDASTSPEVAPLLAAAAKNNPRIRVQGRKTNGGIARATNDALAMATGDYVVMLDHDDVLRPHALLELARRISTEPSLDALYSDEDKITAAGDRVIPFLKPAFSPEYLLAVMYPGHVLCVRTEIARATGGFDPAYDGVQDYEFLLRVSERTRHIGHVPRILYHWRQSPASSALEGNVKGDMDRKQLAAVRAHLQRRRDPRLVASLGRHRLKISAAPASTARTAILLAWPRVPVGAPGCDWARLFENAESAVFALPSVVVPEGLPPLSRLTDEPWETALRELAKANAADVFIVFTVPPLALEKDWIRELSALAAQSDSGCVAPVLIAREGHLFESGRTLSSSGSLPLMRGFKPDGDGYNGTLLCSREVSAVSARCVAFRRELLTASPEISSSAWTEFCLSLAAKGLFNRICAHVRIQISPSWHEAVPIPAPTAAPAWDPYFNPHFDPSSADYSLANPPFHFVQSRGFVWHLDTPPPATLRDGCLTLRGWCFRRDGKHAIVQVKVAGITWSTGCQQPRPDVAALYVGLTGEACGFVLHLRLPAGHHVLELQAISNVDEAETMLRQPIHVPYSAALQCWLWPHVGNRAAFQLMAAPSVAPRSLRPEKFPPPRTAPTRWPKFSIVTPSYQQVRFLRKTMRSVIDQPFVKRDYVVQDGGSTDGSDTLIREETAHLAAWESARDQGQADAIVRGFSKTRGGPNDVMAWLNSDDFYLPGTLAFVADFFARHPTVDIVYGQRVLVDEQSREIGRWFLPPHDPEVLRLNDYIPQETMFWRRRIWDKVGGIDPSFKFAMDWDLLLRFQSAGAKIVRVPYFLACFRIHAAQKTSAQMESIGQKEIDTLRLRIFGRVLSPTEIENHPRMLRYVRRSAWIEFLWRRFGIRHW